MFAKSLVFICISLSTTLALDGLEWSDLRMKQTRNQSVNKNNNNNNNNNNNIGINHNNNTNQGLPWVLLNECGEELKNVTDELSTTKDELNKTMEDLNITKGDLSATKDELNKTMEDLDIIKSELSEAKEDMERIMVDLNITTNELIAVNEQLNSTMNNLTICEGKLGEPNFEEELVPEMKTVVIGGWTRSGRTADVEILSLEEETNSNCVKPEDYPLSVSSHETVLYEKKITVCGGYDGSFRASCYQLNAADNSWEEMPPMTQARYHFAAVVTPYGIMVTGGNDGARGIDTVEYFDGTTWQSGPSMPEAIYAHCAVQLNSTHTAVIGGNTGSKGRMSNVYVFDWTQQQWSEVQSMKVARRAHSCTTLPNGNVFVVGSFDQDGTELTTEVYDPAADQWTYGPPLPFENRWYGGGLVLVDEKPTLVGGYVDGALDNRVFQLVGQEWVQLETTLQSARYYHTATQVPVESLPGCTEN